MGLFMLCLSTLFTSVGFNFCSSFSMLCHKLLGQHVAISRNMKPVCKFLSFKLQEIRQILLSSRYMVVHKKTNEETNKKPYQMSWIDRNTALVHVKNNWYVQQLHWDHIGGGREQNPQPNLGYTGSFTWIIHKITRGWVVLPTIAFDRL